MVFGLNKINLEGFRRLRTSSQLTFESIPQILFQSYLYLKLRNDEEKLDELGIGDNAIAISILFSVLHSILEFTVLKTESVANQTNVSHYYMTCLNGRFGWVPFEHIFTSNLYSKLTAE